MTNRLRWLALAGVFAALAAGAAACGTTEITTTHDRCYKVDCGDYDETGLKCDPYDGQCKCGGPGGNICKEGEACNKSTGNCFSPKCELVEKCDGGQSCDPLDGVCKCGDTPCAEGEYCVDRICRSTDLCAGKTCGIGMTCDEADGQCKCYGVVCEQGESCLDGSCTEDPCAGVNCTLNAICSRADGTCHCMGSSGPICNQGEACVSASMQCEGSNKCDGVVCGGGTACDPVDGECHCDGTYASHSPICDPGQTCVNGECIGGELCADKECPSDFQCDPTDGICKCGSSRGGPECAPEDTCTVINEKWTCAQPCTLLGTPTGCPGGEACVFDVRLQSRKPFCAPEGNKGDGQECLTAYDCAPGYFCNQANTCRQLCPTGDHESCLNLGAGYVCSSYPGMPDGISFCTR